jgi:hypothetical protein
VKTDAQVYSAAASLPSPDARITSFASRSSAILPSVGRLGSEKQAQPAV